MSDKSSPSMTDSEKTKCHAIIHSAAVAAGGVGAGLAQIPMSDNLVIMPIQIAMVGSLGAVFDQSLAESAIKSLISAAAGTVIGRSVSQALLGWLPGIGNAINASTAFTLTETIGWTIANNFADEKREAEKKAEAERIKHEEEAAKEAESIEPKEEAARIMPAKRAELRRKEEAGRETERIMRAKRAEFRRKEWAARESQEAEEIAKAVPLEKAPSSDEVHQESVTVPAQNTSPQKTNKIITIVNKVLGKICGGVSFVCLYGGLHVLSLIVLLMLLLLLLRM